MKTATITKTTRYTGVRDTAAQVGCTPGHLSLVLHGRRQPGRQLRRKLERMGIELPTTTTTTATNNLG